MSVALAPRVDKALSGRVGWRDEVRARLRAIEGEARALREEMQAVLLTGAADDAMLRAALDEIERLLEDPSRSPLLRALRRRPWELERGSAPRRSLDQRWAAVARRARSAVQRTEAAAAFRKALARVRARFGERLPWHLARALERAHIRDSDADGPDPRALLTRVQRLGRIEQELAARSAELAVPADPPLEQGDWPDDVSLEELTAAAHAREARDGASPRAWRERSRAAAATHLTRLLGSAAPRSRREEAAEAAAREIVACAPSGSAGTADVDAWAIAVRAAARDRNPGGALVEGDAAPLPETGSLLFAVPLFGPYVQVRTGSPWPARIEERTVRCGSPARVVAANPPGQAGVALAVEEWAQPLFTLPDNNPGAEWLATAAPAEIVPFARTAPDRWFAVVRRRGALKSLGEPARGSARERGAVVRVRPPVERVSAEGTLPVGPPASSQTEAFGWRTETVPVPLADLPSAWLRSGATPAGHDHVEAEQAFFQAAGLQLPGQTPRCLGRADRPSGGYLYAPPLAFRTAESKALRAWEAEDPLAFVMAAARLWRRLTDAGLALGFYHPATLGFRVLFGRRGAGDPPLEAVALAAPLGTRLGASYRRSRESLELFPPYERLGLRLPPAQLNGDVAMPETEAVSLTLYTLDRLLAEPLEIPAGAPWDEFVDMLEAKRPRSSALHIVEKLCALLGSPEELAETHEAIAAGVTSRS